jgi:phosphate transport system substrate-binding protein
MGYFGLSYFEQNQDKLKLLQIDGGEGCVTPSKETVQSGEYKPLSRPLFVYVKDTSLKRPEVDAFLKFYIDNADRIGTQAQFVPMTAEQAAAAKEAVEKLIVG